MLGSFGELHTTLDRPFKLVTAEDIIHSILAIINIQVFVMEK